MHWCFPAGPLSVSTRLAACRADCASKVVDLLSVLHACRSCQRRLCSIFSTEAISSGVFLSPYRDFGIAAVDAAGGDFALGSAGAGFGATTADLRGGLGSASAVSPDGHTIGALVAVNAVGQTTIGDGAHFWAAPYEIASEFGGLGWPVPFPSTALALRAKGLPAGNTTIAVVATDAMLTKPQARRLAVAAQDGFARAIRPVHTPLDGDTVFAAATGARALLDSTWTLASLGALAADVLARAVARGVYMAASSVGLADMPPSWKDRFGG